MSRTTDVKRCMILSPTAYYNHQDSCPGHPQDNLDENLCGWDTGRVVFEAPQTEDFVDRKALPKSRAFGLCGSSTSVTETHNDLHPLTIKGSLIWASINPRIKL